MTYDGGLRFLRLAAEAMEKKDYEAQHTNISKAQNILLELLSSLDHSVNPELASGLDRIYRYLYDRLVHANVSDDIGAVKEAQTLMSQLRDTWAEADEALSGAEQPTAVLSAQG